MKNNILLKLISKIVRVRKNRIVFMSYNGHYNDSPKQIFLEMYKKNKDLEYIWLVEKKHLNEIPSYTKAIEYRNNKSSLLLWFSAYNY